MAVQTPARPDRRIAAPTPLEAFRSLAELGFLVRSDLPDRPGPAYLLVALREQPALSHYDPEAVDYWVGSDGRGRHERLTRLTGLPIDERPFAWGEIRIVDRLRVANEYLTFGGTLSADLIDDVAVAVFTSPVPLLRRGGHSQGWDEAAENVGAFFGRVRIAVDYVRGFEAKLVAARPETLYGAFIADLADRYRSQPTLPDIQPRLWSIVSTEEHRLENVLPADLRAGRSLLKAMHVD